jgi:MBG domain (YGX type)
MESGFAGARDPSARTDAAADPATHKTVKLVAGMFLAALALFVALFAFAGGAHAMTRTGGTGTTDPWISSDMPDYPPGATVGLLGGNWQAGESVHIYVNDSDGQTWAFNDDVTADSSGNVSDSFNLPNWFVASYSVTATGASGSVATTSFTDGNLTSVSGTVTDSVTHNPLSGVTVTCDTTSGCNNTFTTTTDAAGNYSFAGGNKLGFATNGPVTLTPKFSKTGYNNGTITLSNVNNGDSFTGKNIALTPSIQNQATLSITGPTDATYNHADYDITTSGGSGTGTLSFDAGSSTACSIASGKLHVVSGTGSCSITATKAGDANYNPTTSDAFAVTIHKAAQDTLTVTSPDNGTYGDKLVPTAAGGSGTGALSFTASGTACQMGSGADAGKLLITSGTGTCSVTAHKASDDNYLAADSADHAVTVHKAAQDTLSITGPADATYNHADYDITTSGGSGTGTLSFDAGSSTACSIASGKLHVVSGTGSCSITATKAGDANYNPTTSDAFAVTIHKAAQDTLTVTSPDNGTYGDKLVPTAAGGSGTGALSFTASGTACQMGSGADAGKLLITSGTGTCSVTAHKASDDNYLAADSADHAVTVHKAQLTVTADDKSKTYDGNAFSPFASTITGFVNGDPSSVVSGLVTYGGTAVGAVHAGMYTIAPDVSGLSADNYAFNPVNGELTINKKGATVAADNQQIVFGGTDPAFTFQTSGVLAGETLAGVSCGVSSSHSAVGTYDIVCSGNTNTDYDVTYLKGTLTVGAWTAANKGFYAPVGVANSIFVAAPVTTLPTPDSNTIWNTVKGGQTVPLKFNVYAGAVEKTALTDILSFKQASVPCNTGDGTDPVDITTTGNTSLRYDTTAMQWIQNWKTPSYTASQPCWRATVKFADGSTLSAFFKLTK